MKRAFIGSCLRAAFVLSLILGTSALQAQTRDGAEEEVRVAQDTLSLTLDQALEIAMSDNPTVKVAEQEVEKKKYAKRGTYAALFPQVDFSGSYQRTLKKQKMYMDGGSLPGMEANDGFEVGRWNSWSFGFTAGMPIISVPLWQSLKLTGYDMELAIEQARSSRLDMIEQVKQAFYGVLMAQDSYHVFRQQYENALANFKDIKQNYEQGLVSEYDMIRANVTVKNIEPSLYDAENAIILSKWRLKALLGVDVSLPVNCVGNLADYEQELLLDYSQQDLSLDNNSSLRQIELQSDMLRKQRQSQLAEYYPSLNISFSYLWNSMNNDFVMRNYKWDPYSVVGLSLNIPIFSGGKRLNTARQTKVSLTQLEWQKEDAVRNLQVALRQSLDQMSTCLKQYEAAQESVSEAEKGYMISLKRYETGKGTLLDVNDSNLQLTQAKLNLSTAIYNYLAARTTLEKTLGQEIMSDRGAELDAMNE